MNFTIDRFEGDFAVVETETGEFFDIPCRLLPSSAKEGDTFCITKNEIETENRQKRIENLMNDLFEEKP